MNRRLQLIRLVGSSLCLLASILFCRQFSAFQFDALVFGAGVPPHRLPAACLWLTHYSPMLMVLPLAMLWVGAARLIRNPVESALAELLAQVALVLAFILLTVCILAWQVPYAPEAGSLA